MDPPQQKRLAAKRKPTLTVTKLVVPSVSLLRASCDTTGDSQRVFQHTGKDVVVTINCADFAFTVNKFHAFEHSITHTGSRGVSVSHFVSRRRFAEMTLSREALRLLILPNAGGNSVVSEVLSFEVLSQALQATLYKTEMEVKYFPQGGSITDYVVKVFGQVIGVSVTRAFKYGGHTLEVADAAKLLTKKLRGVNQSTKNSLMPWSKQILHIWVGSSADAKTVYQAYRTGIDNSLRRNTVVLLSIAHNIPEIFTNNSHTTNNS